MEAKGKEWRRPFILGSNGFEVIAFVFVLVLVYRSQETSSTKSS